MTAMLKGPSDELCQPRSSEVVVVIFGEVANDDGDRLFSVLVDEDGLLVHGVDVF